MPRLDADIYQPFAAEGLVAYAVSSSTIGREDPENLAAFVSAMGLTMPVLVDWDAAIYDDWRVNDPDGFAPYPREFIIGRDGRIIYAAATIDVPAMTAAVQTALDGS